MSITYSLSLICIQLLQPRSLRIQRPFRSPQLLVLQCQRLVLQHQRAVLKQRRQRLALQHPRAVLEQQRQQLLQVQRDPLLVLQHQELLVRQEQRRRLMRVSYSTKTSSERIIINELFR